jgi:4-amino-4-deoxy-L-arabinose transferase-like glycosyltransferase
MAFKARSTPRYAIVGLGLIFLAGFFLRAYHLSSVPAGVLFDEAYDGLDAMRIAAGARPIFLPANSGREVLFIYLQALSVHFLGSESWPLRVPSVIVGCLTLPASFLVVRRLFNWRVALLATGWLAVSFWHVTFSRIGLRAISVPLFGAVAFYCLWRGLDAAWASEAPELAASRKPSAFPSRWLASPGLGWFALAGIILGLSLYTYLTARFLPLVVLAFAGYLAVGHRPRFKPALPGLVLAGLLTLLVFLPEGIYFLRHRADFAFRANEVSVFNPVVNHGDLVGTLLFSSERALGEFTFQGDDQWERNIPSWPIFDPASSVLLVLGFVLAVRAIRNPRFAFLLLWLALLVIPSMLSALEVPNFLRVTGLIPALFVLPALGADWLWSGWENWIVPRLAPGRPTSDELLVIAGGGLRAPHAATPEGPASLVSGSDWGSHQGALSAFAPLSRPFRGFRGPNVPRGPNRGVRGPNVLAALPVVVATIAFAWGSYHTYRSYFGLWATASGTVQTFNADHLLAVQVAQSLAAGGSPVYVGADDAVAPSISYFLRSTGESSSVRLFYPAYSLILPPIGTAARYVFAQRDLLPAPILGRFFPGQTGQTLARAADGEPILEYQLAAKSASFQPEHPLPARFGNDVQVDGFDLPRDATAGESISVRWYWHILSPEPRELTFFNQVVGPTGGRGDPKVGTVDARAFAPDYWPAGTRGVSTFDVPIDPDAPTGAYNVLVGLYYHDNLMRLPIFDPQGQRAGPQLTLGPIKVHGRPPPIPTVANPQPAQLADGITFLGDSVASVPAPGQPLQVTLYWSARSRPSTDYTVFVHLLDSAGHIAAQADAPPESGGYPTSVWDAGETIADPHELALPGNLSPGSYTLEIGLYQPATGQRLPLVDGAGHPVGDRILLAGQRIGLRS